MKFINYIEKVSGVDKTLNAAALAELQKTINGIDLLIGKANRALKQRSETEINQINGVKLKLFPKFINLATINLKKQSR